MRYFILIFHLIFIANISAQVSQPARYEIEIGNLNESFFTASAAEQGLFLINQNLTKTTSELHYWIVIRLDTALNQVFMNEFHVKKEFLYKGSAYSDNKLVLLFQSGIESTNDLLFITYEIDNENYKAYNYTNFETMFVSHFEKKDDTLILGGKNKNKTVVRIINLSLQKDLILPGFFDNEGDLLQINVNPDDDLIKVITSEENEDNDYEIKIRSFSLMGALVETKSVKGNNNISLTDAILPKNSARGSILVGAFSLNKPLAKSNGIFTSDIDTKNEKEVETYKYTSFDHYFKYMGEKRETSMKMKIARKAQKNKDYKFDTRLKIRDIVYTDQQYIVLAEVYVFDKKFVEGVSNGYSNSGIANSSIQKIGVGIAGGPNTEFLAPGFNSNYRFDPLLDLNRYKEYNPYTYSHAIIIGLDDNGQKIWDNSMTIDNITSLQLKNYVFLASLNQKQTLLYLKNQYLHIKNINENETINKQFKEPLRLKNATDVLNQSVIYFEGLKSWHNNTFYAYGVNSISTSNRSASDDRKVFFINKIVVK